MNLMEKYQKKASVPEAIRWDVLSKIHLSTARRLVAEGVNFRLSTPAITEVEDALNQTWLDCLHGKATIDNFQVINEQWADAVRAANERSKRATLF